MSMFGFFKRSGSAPVARERLQILLAYERGTHGQSDLLTILREDILSAIKKHVTIDPDNVQIKMDRGDTVSMLEIDIEIPNSTGLLLSA
jgi:cell division topological specificity factor